MHSALLQASLFHVWVYLQAQPLLGLTATLAVWELAAAVDRRLGRTALSNPIVLSIVILAVLLLATHVSYATYFSGAQYVHFLLGPATVALAVPMFANLPAIRKDFAAIVVSLVAGGVTAAVSAMAIAHALGAPLAVVVSLGPKSVTTPIAMAVATGLGGQPALAAVFVLITGMVGTLAFPAVFRAARVVDWRARGLAAGTAAHGMATARMLTLDQTAGAFGGVAIGLNGIVTSLALPVLVTILGY